MRKVLQWLLIILPPGTIITCTIGFLIPSGGADSTSRVFSAYMTSTDLSSSVVTGLLSRITFSIRKPMRSAVLTQPGEQSEEGSALLGRIPEDLDLRKQEEVPDPSLIAALKERIVA